MSLSVQVNDVIISELLELGGQGSSIRASPSILGSLESPMQIFEVNVTPGEGSAPLGYNPEGYPRGSWAASSGHADRPHPGVRPIG